MSVKKLVIIIITILAIGAGNFALHYNLRHSYSKIRQFNVLETLPTAQVAKLLWLELDAVAADYYYLKAIQHFGTSKYMKGSSPHPLLYPILDLATNMDPYFSRPYTFGGVSLNLLGMDFSKATKLLSKGHKYLPENYRIAYELGFNLFYFEHRYKEAAAVFAEAARLPEAPDFIAPLAARLAAQGGTPELGLVLIEELLPTITDDTLKEVYQERRLLLILEIHLNNLEKAAALFHENNGRWPADVQELQTAGIISQVPEEPFGGVFEINPEDGTISSSTHKERLQIFTAKQTDDGNTDE